MGRLGWVLLGVTGIAFWFVLGFAFRAPQRVLRLGGVDRRRRSDERHLASVLRLGRRQSAGHKDGVGELPLERWQASSRSSSSTSPPRSPPGWCPSSRRSRAAREGLVSGGALFSGYIYLCSSLHGVFYGPMLLWLALALRFALGPRPTPRGYAAVAIAGFVAAASRPFTLVFGLALAVASPFEFRWLRDRRAIALVAVLQLVGVSAVRARGPGTPPPRAVPNLTGSPCEPLLHGGMSWSSSIDTPVGQVR